MQIIDADTHISPAGGDMARINRAGVDKALTWLRSDYKGTEIEGHNAYVYQAAQRYPDQILGFGSDAPFLWLHVVVATYLAALHGEVSEEDKALVMGGNVARLFGLSD